MGHMGPRLRTQECLDCALWDRLIEASCLQGSKTKVILQRVKTHVETCECHQYVLEGNNLCIEYAHISVTETGETN